MNVRCIFFSALILLCISAAGCGGKSPSYSEGENVNAVVTGTVTAAGSPIANATISFESASIGAYGGTVDGSGKYSVKLPEGLFKVTVTPVSSGTNAMTPTKPGELAPTDTGSSVPEAYRSSATTPAEAQIAAGENVFDLDMKEEK